MQTIKNLVLKSGYTTKTDTPRYAHLVMVKKFNFISLSNTSKYTDIWVRKLVSSSVSHRCQAIHWVTTGIHNTSSSELQWNQNSEEKCLIKYKHESECSIKLYSDLHCGLLIYHTMWFHFGGGGDEV